MGSLLAQCMRSRWVPALCLLVVALSLALPPGRAFGLPLCQFKVVTQLPCLGCGLTRSFVDMAHLHVGRAAFFNPAGVLLFPLVLLLAGLTPVRAGRRERFACWAEKHSLVLNCLAISIAVVFVVNGVARIIWLLLARQPSPW